MPSDDNDRVFDISKPQKVAPSATSKPVIVGHQPMMGDPMVTVDTTPPPRPMMPTDYRSIPVSAHDEPKAPPTAPPVVPDHPESVVATAATDPSIPANAVPPPTVAPPSQAVPPPGDLHLTLLDDLIGHQHKAAAHTPDAQPSQQDQVQSPVLGPTHGHKRKKGKAMWLLLALIVIFVAAYLVIDSQLIKNSINLPVHIFKQPVSTSYSL